MDAKLKAVMCSLLVLGLTACVSSSAKLNSVHLGMAKSELVQRLGEPQNRSGQGNTEYLTYYLTNDDRASGQPYMVRLIDGKVESFGRFVQLADTLYAPGNGATPSNVGAIMPYAMNMDVVTQLQHLKALEERGVLTPEEAKRVRERLLSK